MKRLLKVIGELKVAKTQRNNFGNYNYRSLEDILEAVKPLLAKNDLILNLSDEPLLIGDRYYIKATAKIYDTEGKEVAIATAVAREVLNRPKFDEAQLTGSTSSYARKYCLNGLFCIDDTKDADTNEYQLPIQKQQQTQRDIFINKYKNNQKMLDYIQKTFKKPITQLKDQEVISIINAQKGKK